MQKVLRSHFRYVDYQATADKKLYNNLHVQLEAAKEVLLREYEEQREAHTRFKSAFQRRVVARSLALRKSLTEHRLRRSMRSSTLRSWELQDAGQPATAQRLPPDSAGHDEDPSNTRCRPTNEELSLGNSSSDVNREGTTSPRPKTSSLDRDDQCELDDHE